MSSKGTAVFPTSGNEKPPETSGFAAFDGSSTSMIEGWRLEPFLPAAVAIPALPVIPVEAPFHPAVPPTFAAEPAVVMGEDREPALLTVVERFVERVGRVGDLLHCLGTGRHGFGAVAQARHQIVIFLRVLRLVLRCIHPRIGAIHPEL